MGEPDRLAGVNQPADVFAEVGDDRAGGTNRSLPKKVTEVGAGGGGKNGFPLKTVLSPRVQLKEGEGSGGKNPPYFRNAHRRPDSHPPFRTRGNLRLDDQ